MKDFGYLLAALLTLPSVALARPPVEPPASEPVNFCSTGDLSDGSLTPNYVVPDGRALTIEYGSLSFGFGAAVTGWSPSSVVCAA